MALRMIPYARVSYIGFLLGMSILTLPVLGVVSSTLHYIVQDYWRVFLILHVILVNVAIYVLYTNTNYQIAIRGGFLGLVFGISVLVSFSGTTWCHFGWYMAALSFFHWSEYMATAITNPKNLSLDSYLLQHSREYHIAAVASWVEFWIEWCFFPGLKQYRTISLLGLIITISGEVLRKGAMYNARTNFNHYIRFVKEEGHELVTHGLYSISRHPSYMGWFYWSVGTQIILCNPVCLIGYTITSWQFFRDRIEDEEITLLNFFGEEYIDYKKNVGTGLPFIKGYRMEL